MSYIKLLTKAMKENCLEHFTSILDTRILPEDLKWVQNRFLVKAIQTDRIDLALLLLQRDCLISTPNGLNSPLHLAFLKKNSERESLVKILLEYDACVSSKNANGDTPLHMAFLDPSCHTFLDALLQQSCRQNAENMTNGFGLSFLHIACTRKNLDVVQFLIAGSRGSKMSNVNSQVSHQCLEYAGYTPLHFAVQSGNTQMVNLLLRHGADVYIKNTYGSTPIHLACELRNTRMVDLLFMYDYRHEDCTNGSGLTHFMAACMGRNPAIVEYLLYTPQYEDNFFSLNLKLVDAQVNKLDDHPFAGYTPLRFIKEFKRTKTAIILMEAGINFPMTKKKRTKKVQPVELLYTKNQIGTNKNQDKNLRNRKRNFSAIESQDFDPIDELCSQTRTRMRLIG